MKMMIDAGHGFETPGKRTVDGMREYEFNRAVANEMKRLLAGYENVTTMFSHSDQKDVPLLERTRKANQANVDVFISIHANAHGNGKEWTSAEGIETFVYESKPKEALGLAKAVQAELIKLTGRKDRGVKTASFHVLKATKMTAILCECGFMTNKFEASLLRTPGYRNLCALAIVNGLATYYKLKKKQSHQPSAKTVYRVQLGAFLKKENAEKLVSKLRKQGYEAFIVSSN
ncbi:N-acetylmuramoyl-L-alanine amidase [Metabacillus malikii]|uniref:N-acetylmuramoyl-L-alanine amidase n=1 Tax=Metabacillus malikii TaxID=1504265 RepID=A0ABT9ZMG8_9BACI|nr:N-acetylmuramoyl-L-alanine amidase [Metabacillus malikii]MDQ0233486.1 N-acetylmuramoyl-L-alanine amidase [Metabacillus malikii]